jgi:hypothetical protein
MSGWTNQSERTNDPPNPAMSQLAEPFERCSRVGRVGEPVAHLETYERVSELSRANFPAEVEVSAARARVSQREEAVDRAERTRNAFGRALSQVYRDPMKAEEQFSTTASEEGALIGSRCRRALDLLCRSRR